uniref:DNA repair protein RecN n=1 Tax=candidate division WOR-3 bacterium TaxID=2052148 RepID=A0A7C4X9U1_UNCW3
MLKFLNVKNFALMEELSLDFESGLTVITGETGAGKSMIVEAIAVLCGERVDDILIRTGKEFAEVAGVFQVSKEVIEALKNKGIEVGEELIIKRKIQRGKRQISYINDQVVGIGLLKDITKNLIDLVGQYENQSLFNPQNHLDLLDRFAGLDVQRSEYKKNFLHYINLKKNLEELQEDLKTKKERIEFLRYEIDEITNANLKIGEEEKLKTEKELFITAEKRLSLINEIISLLYESEANVYSALSKANRLINELVAIDPTLKSVNSNIELSSNIIEEVCRQLIDYRENINFSEEHLEEILSRLDLLNRLKKKYKREIKEILDYQEEMKSELARIEVSEDEVKNLKETIEKLEKEIQAQAEKLSRERHRAAREMEKKILQVLKKLGMEKARFEIKFEKKLLCEDGFDNAEFYISPNPGEELKPLRKIGSGGEISRVTLGLKTILSEIDKIPILIFDEVDTGIGGRIAEAVGELLLEVSRNHQIICITHLPQISVFAHNHILVKKEFRDRSTITIVTKLDREQRKMEIARMLAGREITRKVVEHAEEMLQKVRP